MTLIVIAAFVLIALLVACGAPVLTTLAIFAVIALTISVFMLIWGFPRQMGTIEALKDDRYDLRREELRRKLSQARAEYRALMAPRYRGKKRAIKGR